MSPTPVAAPPVWSKAVGRAVAPPVTGGRPDPTEARGPRRITFRVLLFLILLGGLAYGAWYVIKVYVGDSYFVGLQKMNSSSTRVVPGAFSAWIPRSSTTPG
jgi:hypothetical protein